MKEMKIEEHGAVYKVQNNTNRRQDYRQRPALGRNLQLSNTSLCRLAAFTFPIFTICFIDPSK
jgi:ethanolamine ammonia-lyase small subunit